MEIHGIERRSQAEDQDQEPYSVMTDRLDNIDEDAHVVKLSGGNVVHPPSLLTQYYYGYS